MQCIEIHPREVGFVLWGHCQNLLNDSRKTENLYSIRVLFNVITFYSRIMTRTLDAIKTSIMASKFIFFYIKTAPIMLMYFSDQRMVK